MKPFLITTVLILNTISVSGNILSEKVPTPIYSTTFQECPVTSFEEYVLISLGDSMTHGTMNATNNRTNALNSYIQKVAESLGQVIKVSFSQPLFDFDQKRLDPFTIPTNLGVDGSDIFELEGLSYYKRSGTNETLKTPSYYCRRFYPWKAGEHYDNVIYPINLLAHKPVTQLDATIWILNQMAATNPPSHALLVLFIGNNDSATASIGLGANQPSYIPLPFNLIDSRLKPPLRAFFRVGQQNNFLNFEPYTETAIQKNLTDTEDFAEQYEHVLLRIEDEVEDFTEHTTLFLCTLPYYSLVGYLFDSQDLEYYLQKIDPTYSVPLNFKRAAGPGETVTDFMSGDRVSLFTFFTMYVLLSQGVEVDEVNRALENDGLVLSENEMHFIMNRIDSYNEVITNATLVRSDHAKLIDVGGYLNDILTGRTSITISGKPLNRKWGRGNSFTIDGVHPGYTGHALVANLIIEEINKFLGLDAPLYDLENISHDDPYVDKDGDGWVPGPDYEAKGYPELLFLFRDPDDTDPMIQPDLTGDIWTSVSEILLEEFF
jgi:hypothetical protein